MPADIRQVLQEADSYTKEVALAIRDALVLQKFMVDASSYDHTITFMESQDLDWIIANVNGHLGGTPYAQVGNVKDSYAATPMLSLWLAYFRFKLGDERISDLHARDELPSSIQQ
jgi:hypothetical protein